MAKLVKWIIVTNLEIIYNFIAYINNYDKFKNQRILRNFSWMLYILNCFFNFTCYPFQKKFFVLESYEIKTLMSAGLSRHNKKTKFDIDIAQLYLRTLYMYSRLFNLTNMEKHKHKIDYV